MINNNLKRQLLKVVTGAAVSSCMVLGVFEGSVISNVSGIEAVKAYDDSLYAEDDYGYVIVDNSYVKITEYFGNNEEVIIPEKINGLEVRIIGESAFAEYEDSSYEEIKSVYIPSTVKIIEEKAFSWCEKLEKVEMSEGIEKIGPRVFSSCSSLKSINIPSSVSEIDDEAFYYVNLENITVDENNKKYDSRDNCNAIIETASDKLVIGCCKTVIPSSVTSIGEGAFYRQSKLTNISIPSSVKTIEKYAFCECPELNSVEIADGLKSIGEGAFRDCDKLTNVTFPSSVTVIGERAFASCNNLNKVELSEGLTKIDKKAFSECDSLKSIYIPSTVNVIGTYAFCGTGLESISVSTENKNYDSRNNCNAIIRTATDGLVCGSSKTQIPSDVKIIGGYAFEKCDITNITIPSSVESIGRSAFADCSKLKNVTIPSSVESIGCCAFAYCSKLKNVTISNGVKSIGQGAFCDTSLTSVTIPSSVKSIGAMAFDNCENLKNVTISNGVTSIGLFAFCNTSLTSVIIPSSVNNIDGYAFAHCSKLKNVTISNGVTRIGGHAFWGCNSLISVKVPSSVNSIDGYAFASCDNLKNVTISNGVTRIGGYAFESCKSLISVKVPSSVTTIGGYAFATNGESFKIICDKESYAHKYAVKYKNKYELNNKITGTTSYTKTASAKAQSFKLNAKSTGGKMLYTSNNKNIKVDGTGKVTIAKNYSGKAVITITTESKVFTKVTKKVVITVNPATIALKSVKNSSKGKITATWNKLSYVNGYVIQYATTSNFKAGTYKIVTVKGANNVSKVISGLSKNKTYYVRIRSFRTVAGKNLYSVWSTKKIVKIGK